MLAFRLLSQTASSGSLSFLLYKMRYYLCQVIQCDDYCLYNALKLGQSINIKMSFSLIEIVQCSIVTIDLGARILLQFIAQQNWNLTLLGLAGCYCNIRHDFFILLQSNKVHYIFAVAHLSKQFHMLSKVAHTYTYSRNEISP